MKPCKPSPFNLEREIDMINKICNHCGGDNILRDAFAEWDFQTQAWVLQNVFDEYFCEDCGGSTTIVDETMEKAS